MAEDLLDLVNIAQGTDSIVSLSYGNTLPLMAAPWGMTHWTLQTDESPWIFHPGQTHLQGFRATHQPSPWIGDYGGLVLMPQIGEPIANARFRASSYLRQRSVLRPDGLDLTLLRYRTRVEMAPTCRGAIFRITFPTTPRRRLLVEPFGGGTTALQSDRRTLLVTAPHNRGGAAPGFVCHYALSFDAPVAALSDLPGGACFVDLPGDAPSIVRVGSSFIDAEQALANLRREVGQRTLEQVRQATGDEWRRTLGRYEIQTPDAETRRTFYSCAYRTQLFPRVLHEPDDSGRPRHRSPYDGAVHSGEMFTDNGFWDTFRTLHPLNHLVFPGLAAAMGRGWLTAAEQGGWLPQWCSPGYRACMIGTHSDAVLADAAVKGVDLDLEAALRAMLRHAREPGDPDRGFGRRGIEPYLRLGYVTPDCDASVAATLDYAYDDFCVAQVAARLGQSDVRDPMLERSGNWRRLFDAASGFFRPRDAGGAFVEPFDPIDWGGPYIEGSAWQCSWGTPHDPAGLVRAHGGDAAFVDRLDRMLREPPHFNAGSYGFEIHEMTEVAMADFGQYAHSNQPVHHVLWMYASAGRPDRVQHWTRRVVRELYNSGERGFCGDEDNGEMGAWYLFAALGFFPLCPGHPTYVLGSPAVPFARVALDDGRRITIEADGADKPDHVYVDSIAADDRPISSLWIGHQKLRETKRLVFRMSKQAEARPTTAAQRPFSTSEPAWRDDAPLRAERS